MEFEKMKKIWRWMMVMVAQMPPNWALKND